MFSLVKVAYAADNPAVTRIIGKIATEILNPIIALLFAIATVVFFWGLFKLIHHADDSGARDAAKQHIMWGLVGMFIMFSAYGIIRLTLNTVHVPPPAAFQ
jgi:hypothetical protein